MFEYKFTEAEFDPRSMESGEIAEIVRSSDFWDGVNVIASMEELADRAGLSLDWKNADGDTFENVARQIQNILNVDLGL